jgi:hypothetical protein
MDRLLVKIKVSYNGSIIEIDGLNRERKDKEAILYTPQFHRNTLTNPDGQEIIISEGHVQENVQGGSTHIPEGSAILSIQKDSLLFDRFEKGMPIEIVTDLETMTGITNPSDWQEFDYIVGGTPLLLHNNAKIVDFHSEQTRSTFITNRHARTAIGLLPNGHWLFVVVDKTNYFEGMTMNELLDLMCELGCTHALNLDGGGSSTMVFNGMIANDPRGDDDEGVGKTVRRVSDAIVVIPK